MSELDAIVGNIAPHLVTTLDAVPRFLYNDKNLMVMGNSPYYDIQGCTNDMFFLNANHVSLNIVASTDITVLEWNPTDSLVFMKVGSPPASITPDGRGGSKVILSNGTGGITDSIDIRHATVTASQIHYA